MSAVKFFALLTVEVGQQVVVAVGTAVEVAGTAVGEPVGAADTAVELVVVAVVPQTDPAEAVVVAVGTAVEVAGTAVGEPVGAGHLAAGHLPDWPQESGVRFDLLLL